MASLLALRARRDDVACAEVFCLLRDFVGSNQGQTFAKTHMQVAALANTDSYTPSPSRDGTRLGREPEGRGFACFSCPGSQRPGPARMYQKCNIVAQHDKGKVSNG